MKLLKLLILLFSSLLTGMSAHAELIGVDPDKLQSMIDQGALVVDVRTQKEWDTTGVIPSSHKLMYYDENGNSSADQWLAELRGLRHTEDQAVVIVCHSGGRSASVGHFLDNEVGMSNVYHLENGISGWINQGKAVEK